MLFFFQTKDILKVKYSSDEEQIKYVFEIIGFSMNIRILITRTIFKWEKDALKLFLKLTFEAHMTLEITLRRGRRKVHRKSYMFWLCGHSKWEIWWWGLNIFWRSTEIWSWQVKEHVCSHNHSSVSMCLKLKLASFLLKFKPTVLMKELQLEHLLLVYEDTLDFFKKKSNVMWRVIVLNLDLARKDKMTLTINDASSHVVASWFQAEWILQDSTTGASQLWPERW